MKETISEQFIKELIKNHPNISLNELSALLNISRSSTYRIIKKYKIKLHKNYSTNIKTCDCGREFNNSQSLNSHYGHCPVRREVFGQKPIDRFCESRKWKKGLTKENNESIRLQAEKQSKTTKGRPGKKHTSETKDHLSKKRTEYLQNNDNHSVWYTFNNGVKDINVQGLWEKRFVEYLLSYNIMWDRFSIKYNGHHRYTPDFYLPKYDIFIEVKGWMKDRDIDKMHRFLIDNSSCDIRLADSLKIFNDLESGNIKVTELEKFIDKYTRT